MRIEQYSISGLGHLSAMIADDEAGVAAIVDPAWEVDRLLREAERLQLKVELALITHTHNDHIEGVDELCARTGAAVVVNPREAERVSAAGRAIDTMSAGLSTSDSA